MIKNNREYIWGEGSSRNQDQARRIAETDLIKKIQVNISDLTEAEFEQSTSGSVPVVREKFRTRHASFSGFYLKGLERVELKHRRTWTVLAYIHHDALAASMEIRKSKIMGFAQAGLSAADSGRTGEALRNYYWGYLLARSYPERLAIADDAPENAQIAFSSRINWLLQDIDIKVNDVYSDGDAVMIALEFTCYGKPISELDFNYYSGMGTEYVLVEDGVADIPIYDTPVSRTRKLTLAIVYKYVSEMPTDPEIEDLQVVFGETSSFKHLKSVKVIFPWIEASGDKSGIIESLDSRTEAIDVLYSNRENIQQFFEILGQYKQLGFITYGQKDDFGDGSGCYVAVADREQVQKFLFYNGETYREINTENTYDSLSDKFQGMYQIWIKEAR